MDMKLQRMQMPNGQVVEALIPAKTVEYTYQNENGGESVGMVDINVF
jgi:hypothetical protein